MEIEVFGQSDCNGQSSGNGELYIQSDGGVYLSISNFQSALSPYSSNTSGTGTFTITSDSTATYYPSNSELLEWCQNQGPETTITATSSINTSCSGSFLAVFWSESFADAMAYDGSVDVLHNAVSIYQGDLFRVFNGREDSKKLMTTIDKINSSGIGKITFASQGIKKSWSMKRLLKSPRYLTSWEEMPVVK